MEDYWARNRRKIGGCRRILFYAWGVKSLHTEKCAQCMNFFSDLYIRKFQCAKWLQVRAVHEFFLCTTWLSHHPRVAKCTIIWARTHPIRRILPTETGFLDPGYLKLVGYSSWGYVRKHVTLCKSSDPPRLNPEYYHLEQHLGYMYERDFVL